MVALRVPNPAKQPLTSWIATIILLLNGAGSNFPGLELLQEPPQIIYTFVRPSLVNDRLDILVIDESDMKPGKRYRVNPDAKTLEEMP